MSDKIFPVTNPSLEIPALPHCLHLKVKVLKPPLKLFRCYLEHWVYILT